MLCKFLPAPEGIAGKLSQTAGILPSDATIADRTDRPGTMNFENARQLRQGARSERLGGRTGH
jgi:hypothetical protein